jgi:hypothetical protein
LRAILVTLVHTGNLMIKAAGGAEDKGQRLEDMLDDVIVGSRRRRIRI